MGYVISYRILTKNIKNMLPYKATRIVNFIQTMLIFRSY